MCAFIRLRVELFGQAQRQLRHSYRVGGAFRSAPPRLKDTRLDSRSMKLAVREGIPCIGLELCITKERHQARERSGIDEQLCDQRGTHPRPHAKATATTKSRPQRHSDGFRAC